MSPIVAHLKMGNTLITEARRLVHASLSVIPVLTDGSKSPPFPWKAYQARHPTEGELDRWFARPRYGLAIVAGEVSGNVEVLDFDSPAMFTRWADLAEDAAPGLLQRLPAVQSPKGGRHLYYRCAVIEHNQKLAQALGRDGKIMTLAETRGEGGYVLAPGCPPACHPLQKPYVLLDGDLIDIPYITTDLRNLLLDAARSLNEYVPPEHTIRDHQTEHPASLNGDRPGDHYAAQTTWQQILEPHGWSRMHQRGDVTLWKRPGKQERAWSATTGYAGSDLLYVFSSNAQPFEPEHAYSKFAAYALLAHGGDFAAAVKALAAEGFGTPRQHHNPQKGGLRTITAAQVLARGSLRTIQAGEVPSWR